MILRSLARVTWFMVTAFTKVRITGGVRFSGEDGELIERW